MSDFSIKCVTSTNEQENGMSRESKRVGKRNEQENKRVEKQNEQINE